MRANEFIPEDWQKVNKQDKTDGLSKKAVDAYRREHPGSKLKTAVTTKPSKLKKGSKSAKRRKSFCARMGGMKKHNASAKTKRDPDSPINKALRRWNCESIEEMKELIQLGESYINNIRESISPKDIHALADRKGIKWDNEPSFLKLTKRLTGKEHLDDLTQPELTKVKHHLENLEENFADGRHPEDKGDSKRHGINTKASVSSLRKTAKQGGRKGQLAHWLANMKAGRAKAKK